MTVDILDEQRAFILRHVHQRLTRAANGGAKHELDAERKQWVEDTLASVTFNLSHFNDILIPLMHEAIQGGTKQGYEIIIMLANMCKNDAVHEYLTFQHLISEMEDPRRFIGSLHYYKQLPRISNYADCDPLVTEQVTALVIAAHHLHMGRTQVQSGRDKGWFPLRSVPEGTIISGDDLIQLIMEYPSAAVQIAETVIERKTVDAQTIKLIINSSTKSLSSGAL